MDAWSEALPQLLLVAALLLIAMSVRQLPPSFWRQLRGHLDQLGNELDRHFDRERWVRRIPIHSAETVRRNEAEFLRERLRSSRKAPRARYVLLLVLVGVLVWALTR